MIPSMSGPLKVIAPVILGVTVLVTYVITSLGFTTERCRNYPVNKYSFILQPFNSREIDFKVFLFNWSIALRETLLQDLELLDSTHDLTGSLGNVEKSPLIN